MKKYLIIFTIIALGITAYLLIHAFSKPENKIIAGNEKALLPRALFLTTGDIEGNGEVSQGVEIALNCFNKHGVFVWLDTREILLRPEALSKYSIIIALTSIGYHDGDRQYSLTYLSDIEMQNITDWVNNGGTLIAEENIGRNTIAGYDRVNFSGELNKDTWKLSELFGIKMKEMDMNGFFIEEKDTKIWNDRIKETLTEDEWILVPTEITSTNLTVMAEWKNDSEIIPAIIQNDYGKGKSFLLTSTYLLHPSNSGGVSGVEQIENFYTYALSKSFEMKKSGLELNTWPEGRSTVFCISFNTRGDIEKYKNVIHFLDIENLPATFFIDSSLTQDEKNILEENKNIFLQCGLYSEVNLKDAEYSEVIRAILMDEQVFKKSFTGLRFPYFSTNFWGLIYANENGFIYDSSIGADYLESYTGSVIPYNIPVAKNSYYKSLNLMEISPMKNDDKYYFGRAETEIDYTEDMQRNDAMLFEKYLFDFFEFAVQKNNGVMVYAGSPQFTGFNEITLLPLKKLMSSLRTKNCWIATIEEVAAYRNKIKNLSVFTNEFENGVKIRVDMNTSDTIKGLSFKLKSKPSDVNTNINYKIKEINGIYFLIFDGKNNDELDLIFK